MQYELQYPYAAQAEASERATFIRRTYAHLAGAVLAFAGLEAVLLNTVDHAAVLRLMLGGRFSWLLIMLAFMGAGWIARTFAYSRSSLGVQYFGLGLYVVVWSVMFLPLMILANDYFQGQNIIPTAGILTLAVFGGLTLSVLLTRKDYSFLAPVLSVGSMIALGVIVAACLFQGLSLGLFFCFAMVALISGYTLYYTSRVLLHYHTDQYVGAALELFACVATLLWYILQILMSLDRR